MFIILRHLPEAGSAVEEQPPHIAAQQKLLEKGLPAQAISRIKVAVVFSSKKIWNFILEAKDLKPYAAAGYRMKKIFGGKLPLFGQSGAQPQTSGEAKSEQDYLDEIKLEPKNLSHYDALGRFYLDKEKLGDAQDIYQYLVNHQPANPEYQARLAYCFYQSKNYLKAAEHYQKSLALDSTQPNRYYNLGLSLTAAGQKPEAARALEKALELEPQNPKFLDALEKLKVN